MNIIFFTGHPAQVHGFKNIYFELQRKGHSVFWITTDKDIACWLLEKYGIKYFLFRRPKNNLISKINTTVINSFHAMRFIKKHEIDIVISRLSPYIVLACFLLRKDLLMLSDTESTGFWGYLSARFGKVLTPKSFTRNLRKDQIRFNGNVELLYLHPSRFQPAKDVSALLEIKRQEPYVIMRFVSWDAYHDKGLSGFSDLNKIKAVHEFSGYARVFISVEKGLPAELELYRIRIPPEKMHDVLAHASLFFGESATMASESAVLGTPAIYLDRNGRGYTDEEEEYGLVFNFRNSAREQQDAIEKGLELLANPNTKQIMANNRQKFLQDKIDVTAFVLWFIENYPESERIMLEHPEYQSKFK